MTGTPPDGRRPEPSRLTLALDMAGLFGARADHVLGVPLGLVDLWEAGMVVPTGEQLHELARRAGCTVEFLFGEPLEPITMNVCWSTKKAAGGGSRCQRVTYPDQQQEQGRLF